MLKKQKANPDGFAFVGFFGTQVRPAFSDLHLLIFSSRQQPTSFSFSLSFSVPRSRIDVHHFPFSYLLMYLARPAPYIIFGFPLC
jgi:hypothetical protein